jgi:hypothetical protein
LLPGQFAFPKSDPVKAASVLIGFKSRKLIPFRSGMNRPELELDDRFWSTDTHPLGIALWKLDVAGRKSSPA